MSTLFIFSCEDDPIEEPNIYFGSSYVDLNGQEWNSDVRAKFAYNDDNYFSLTFDRYEGKILRDAFHFRKIEFKLFNEQVLNSDYNNDCQILCTSFSTGYNDQAGDSYNILEDDQFEDWIIIDSFNDQNMEIWGRFQASFIKDDRIPKMDNYPDTLYFKNGTFNGKILE